MRGNYAPQKHRWNFANYERLKAAAGKEDPPGSIVLYLGALDTLKANDPQPVRTAAGLVKGNVPEDERLGILGSALYDIDSRREALDLLRQAADLSFSVQNLGIIAGRLADAGETPEALECYDKALRMDPQDHMALLERGCIYEDMYRYRRACEDWAQALRLWAQFGDAHLRIASAEVSRAHYEDGLRHAKRAAKLGCDNLPLAWYTMAVCHVHGGRIRRARRAARKCLRLAPEDENVRALAAELEGLNEFGISLFESGFDAEAYPWLDLEASREKPPGLASLYLGALRTKKECDVRFITDAGRYTARAVAEDRILQVSGSTKHHIGLCEEGIKGLRRAVEICPSFRNRFCLASTLAMSGVRDESREMLEELRKEEPEDAGVLFYLAWVAEAPEEALELYKAARDADPEESSAQYQVGHMLEELERYEEALKEYQKTLPMDSPTPAENRGAVALCHFELGQFQEAADWAKESLWYDPSYELARDILEDSERELNNSSDAKGASRPGIRKNP